MTRPASIGSGVARGVRQSMAWIHAWLGLLAGWILFAMFLTGAASYFRPEITRWMQPELRPQPVSAVQAAQSAIAHLQATSPDDLQWFIYLPDERTGATRVFVRPKPAPDGAPAPRRAEFKLDPATGQPLQARDTRGGEHFYRFHFQLQIPHPWGRWLAGLCAAFMLAAIISGVITHKRLFADFFTLRWGKGQRSWLDAHNASAVLALPFHAMITYTGLITLVAMYMPWPVLANFHKPADFTAAAYGAPPEDRPSGLAMPLQPVGPMIDAATRAWGDPPRTLVIRNPNDAAATVTLTRGTAHRLDAGPISMTLSGADGRLLSQSPEPGPALGTAGVMLGLHLGHYAGPVLRWTYFLLGLTGAAMVGTGLVLWSVKRRRPGASSFLGLRLVDRLNVAAIACLPAGMAAFFLANRLLPADLPGRAGLEVEAMFWVWFGLAAAACLRPLRRAWVETLALAAAAFLALPIVNALTTDRGFFASLAAADGLFIAFDVAFLMVGVVLAFAAWRAARPAAPKVRARAELVVEEPAHVR